MRARIEIAIVSSALVVIGFGGCSTASPSSDATGATTRYSASVSLGQQVASRDQLRKESNAVIVGEASGASVEYVQGVPFTVTAVTVARGTLPVGSVVRVRQTGSTDYRVEGVSDLLESGSTYLLYLSKFELVQGKWTGEYTVTAEQGAWKKSAGGFERSFASDTLSRNLSEATVLEELG